MKRYALKILFYACLFSMVTATVSQARDVTLQWDPSTDSSVTGYKLEYNADSATIPFTGTGAAQGASPYDAKNVTTTTLTGLDPSRAYYFAVTAYDAAGTESPYSNIVTVPEATPPTVSITTPATNTTISGTVSVTASATDNVGVTKVEFYLNGVLQTSDASTPYVYSLNTTSLASGTYTLMAKAYDAAGNVAQSSNVTVTVVNDTTAPTVSLTAPANNATVSGTTTITASASDNVGVSKVEFYRSGTLLYATNVAPFSYGWNTTTVANGSYTLTAKAYDNTGNVAQSANVQVTVNNTVADTTAPSVSISSPAAGSTVSGAVTVSATASDNIGVSKVEFYLNNVLQTTDTASPYSFSWNTASAVDGVYSLTAKASDASGNSGSSSTVTITVSNMVVTPSSSYSIWSDATVPSVVDAGPDSAVELGVKFRADTAGYITGIRFYKASTNTGTHIGNLWDNAGKLLATATFTNETASGWQMMNFATPVAIAANTVYVGSYHANTGHYSDSLNYFSGKGVDNPPLHALADGVSGYSGVYAYGSSSSFPNQGWNSSNYWVDVVYASNTVADTAAPSASISSPAAGSTVSGAVTISATASDNVGVSKVEFYLNNVLQSTDTASPYSFNWNTAVLANGSYTLSTKAYDAAGNVGQSSATIVTVNNPVPDTLAPTVSVTSPVNNATVSGTVSVSAAASDNVGVTKVEFYVNGKLQTSDTASPYSFSWNTALLANGSYELTTTAYDAAGNIAQSSIVTITVNNLVADTIPPSILINSPSNNAKVRRTVTISTSATDNVGVTKMELSIDSVLKATALTGAIAWNWDTSSYAKGTHVINVKAYDAANNVSSKSINVSK